MPRIIRSTVVANPVGIVEGSRGIDAPGSPPCGHAYLMHLIRTEEETESVHFLNSTQQYTIQMGEEATEYYRVDV